MYVLLILVVALLFPRNLSAETIYLKSGKKVEGKIIERTNSYIKVDFMGAPITYFTNEIDKIEGSQEPWAVSAPLSPTLSGKLYVNEEYRFEIVEPKGWFTRDSKTDKGPVLRYQKVKDDKVPSLRLAAYRALKNTALELAQKDLEQFRVSAKQIGGGEVAVIDAPQEIQINNTKAARFLIYYTNFASQQENDWWKNKRMLCYFFVKDNVAVTITFFGHMDKFQEEWAEVENTINTFRFI